MKFPPNLCDEDRYVRGVVCLVCFYFSIFASDLIGDILLVIFLFAFAVLNLISFIFKWCPVYHIAGVSTCKTKFK